MSDYRDDYKALQAFGVPTDGSPGDKFDGERFDTAMENAWSEYYNVMAFAFPATALRLIQRADQTSIAEPWAAHDCDDDDFARLLLDTVTDETATFWNLDEEGENAQRCVDRLAPWIAEARFRGLVTVRPTMAAVNGNA